MKHELTEYLLRTRPKFRRGEAGRKAPNLWEKTDGAPTFAHLLASYWGWGVEYRYCELLEFALKHHKTDVRKKCQKELSGLFDKHISTGNTRFINELGKAVKAVSEAPQDPLVVAIVLALHIIESSRKDDEYTSAQLALCKKKSVNVGEFFRAGRPTQAQVVAIAEDFFDMKGKKEKDFFSLKRSLFRTAKKVLRIWIDEKWGYARGA